MNNLKRIYTVTNRLTGEKRLVESHHPSHAVRVITENVFDVHVTPSAELATMLENGSRVMRQSQQPTNSHPTA